jgi:hypothetical protein
VPKVLVVPVDLQGLKVIKVYLALEGYPVLLVPQVLQERDLV